ncbi:Lrp/AsnC family transcriptional regulator [Limibaculum sp. FT325]|uniref:siroheme decarboxylase subunit beta n=1 Tax=Thermohalobaculum sediminis TaxID=2939436 RepID=UPI0020BF56B9|nr:Lrp/AsnC family transcriptional regulator [Limibaculum sediminis]MCL5778370.1 Lrp/AsnC family transcriptional regulator [Limibaculum sediminis]
MGLRLDPRDHALLNDWQRDLPLVPRPYAAIAGAMGIGEAEVLARLAALGAAGAISRVGGTFRPNTAGASTLAAVAAPDWRIDEVAEAIGRLPGVNHSYLREHERNIWFVATGPDRAHVAATLARIEAETGLDVLDVPLVRPFNLDLGFSLDRPSAMPVRRGPVDARAVEPGDAPILQALSDGLGLVSRPFAALGARLGRSEDEVLARIRVLAAAGVVSRIGIIVRHRALGWRSNAMVVWQVPEADIARAGPLLAAVPGVTLCYQRRPVPGVWPYTLYCMIHARSRAEAIATLEQAAEAAGLAATPHEVLFSLRCFKQTGALIAGNAAAEHRGGAA